MTMESKRMRNQKIKILRFLWRKSYSSDGGAYGFMAPGSLAGAARLVLGKANDLRGPNGFDGLRSPPVDDRTAPPTGERTPLPTGECTTEGRRGPSIGDIGGERAPSSAGEADMTATSGFDRMSER